MFPKRPPELQAVLEAIEREGPYASIEEANRVLGAQMRDYNTRPQAALGGLSPDEMSQLLYGDWASRGALRLDETLSLDELSSAAVFADARVLLEYVRDHGPVKETAARNLPRAAVAALLPRLRTSAPRLLAAAIGDPGPVNEGGVLWLPVLRHTLMFAGLLMRRKGLRLTPRGRETLVMDRAGELYALLFRTFFQELDLRALGRDDRHPGLQTTIAYTFYKLRSAARDWASPQALARIAWLASAQDAPTEWEAAHEDFRHYAFRHRVLDPLVQFGLLEERLLPSEERWKEVVEYRCTPMFDRFVKFKLGAEGGRDPFLM
jgi:hypothetical protein